MTSALCDFSFLVVSATAVVVILIGATAVILFGTAAVSDSKVWLNKINTPSLFLHSPPLLDLSRFPPPRWI
jgi:hypothetical protein